MFPIPRLSSWLKQELRLIAVFLCTVAAVTAVVVFQTGLHLRQQLLSTYQVRLGYVSHTRNDILRRQFDQLRRDVLFLSATPPVSGLVRAVEGGGMDKQENTRDEVWRRRLNAIFSAFLRANPDLASIRFIGVADQGKELIRVERGMGNQPDIVPSSALQPHGARDYMRATIRLRPGQVYFSEITDGSRHPMHPNAKPVPTLRAATPIFDAKGRVFGIVIINYDVQNLLLSLRNNIPVELRLYLANRGGDYLLHPDLGRTFGFERGRRWRWQEDFRPIPSGLGQPDGLQAYASPDGVSYARWLDVPFDTGNPGHYSRIYVELPDQVVANLVHNARLSALGSTLAIFSLIGVILAVYQRKYRQASARRAELAAIVESSHDAIVGCAPDSLITSWNQAAERMLGYTATEALGQPLARFIQLPATDDGTFPLQRVQEKQMPLELRCSLLGRDERWLDVAVTASPVRSEDRLGGAALIIRDVTEQMANEMRILELNSSLEKQVEQRTAQIRVVSSLQNAILDYAGNAIIATDLDGMITLFNPAAERMLGYPADSLIGQSPLTRLHSPAELAERASLLRERLNLNIEPGFDAIVGPTRLGEPNESRWTYTRRNGSTLPVWLTVSALEDGAGLVSGYLAIASDITQREEDRRNLEDARDQLAKAAEVAELGIWSWSLADDTLEWNDRMFEIYDIPKSFRDFGLYYNHWRGRIHPDDVERVEHQLQQTLEDKGVFHAEFRIRRQDGEVRHLQAAAQAECSAEGTPLRIAGISRDITLEREREAWLNQAKAAADSANRAKSEFLANMSHEIRTPMNAILGMLQLMQQTSLNPRQADYADKAASAAKTLLGILNDILDFSRVEAGKLTLAPHPFSVDKLLRDVGVIMSANVGEKDVEVLFDIDPELPDWITADSLRLQQILINLSGNALKFTERGEVVISAELRRREQHRLRLAFCVRDTGIGIAPEQLQRIFEGFSQAEASTARRYGGSGLGLAISQRLVALMGGKLEVDSEPGKGSRFRFEIDCDAAEAPAPVSQVVDLRDLSCLVIDDNENARQAQSALLRAFGWHVDTAASGEEALAQISQIEHRDYDVILVDWRMPSLDGWETCQRLRRLQNGARASVILLVTAHGREIMAQRQALSPGMFDNLLVKPVTASMLFDAIADARAGAGRREAEPAALENRAPRLCGLRLLLVEDNLTNQQVARELLSNEGASIDVADCGQAALDAVLGAANRYDLVLMDIQMPDMDGYAVTRILRRTHPSAELPIVAMTANVMPADREAARNAGMDNHVGKPFDLNQLVEVILHHARGHAAPPAAAPPSSDLQSGQLLNSQAALVRFGGNRGIYRHTLLSFCEESRSLLEGLLRARADGQRQQGVQLLHTLKGLAATVGAETLAMLAAGEEKTLRDPAREWPADHEELAAALAQADQAAQLLAEQLECSAPPAQPEEAELAAKLATLTQLLREANVEAVQLFIALKQQHGIAHPDEFARLDAAIMHMNFAEAIRICEDMRPQKAPQT
ncbi:response regulator [Chromobacterium phragmitis]|uniref:Sensory/regulatory protein RpfC n=1 Tax=Chromobacterium phragmitis TaxID=2202141 RepID=A0A344UG36_9NEIS|nr:response regulator [Chromobacterium phragmitis]AXE34234.1 hybrid sensor histidine kinase/response regulator [Chromobacterium phragmitis]